MKTGIKTSFTGVMAALFLAGCVTVGPDYQVPTLPATNLTETIGTTATDRVEREWWHQFNDANLNQLMTVAYEHNPSVAVAKANLYRAMAIFDDVEDNDWPTGSVEASYSSQRQALPGTPISAERISLQTRKLGISAGWSLDIVGKFERAEQAANADAEAYYYAWKDARLTLLANIASQYIEYKGLQARLSVANETLQSLTKTAFIVSSQVENGFATQLDALRIESQIAFVKADIPSFRAATEATRQSIIALAGGESVLQHFNWQADVIPALSGPVALTNGENFLKQRPDVLAAERRLAASTANIGVATADLYPSVSMTGFLGLFSSQGTVLTGDARAWSMTPTLSWQALDLDSVRARIRIADAERDASFARFEQTVLSAVSETQTALSNYGELQRRMAALMIAVEANKEALSLAQYQYQAGSIDLLSLLDVERQWLAARDKQVRARAQMTQAIVSIYTALGGGLLQQS